MVSDTTTVSWNCKCKKEESFSQNQLVSNNFRNFWSKFMFYLKLPAISEGMEEMSGRQSLVYHSMKLKLAKNKNFGLIMLVF